MRFPSIRPRGSKLIQFLSGFSFTTVLKLNLSQRCISQPCEFAHRKGWLPLQLHVLSHVLCLEFQSPQIPGLPREWKLIILMHVSVSPFRCCWGRVDLSNFKMSYLGDNKLVIPLRVLEYQSCCCFYSKEERKTPAFLAFEGGRAALKEKKFVFIFVSGIRWVSVIPTMSTP